MPIYEYRRPDGSTFEVMQKFSDLPLATDPESGQPVQRVLHAPAIHFKGKGFHNTDYGTRKRKAELERSAEDGANKTEAKAKEKRAESSSSSSSDGPKGDAAKGDAKKAA